jgi:putative oxidoreductase
MKIASILARYLVGLIFTGFGLNGFLNFIHQPPAKPLPIQFLVSVGESNFAAFFLRFTSSVGCCCFRATAGRLR